MNNYVFKMITRQYANEHFSIICLSADESLINEIKNAIERGDSDYLTRYNLQHWAKTYIDSGKPEIYIECVPVLVKLKKVKCDKIIDMFGVK